MEIVNLNTKKDWFADWFNCKYYNLLYQNRGTAEAQNFIHNLIAYLNPKKGSSALDLACGSGRHSIFLNSHGLITLGADLSKNSIASAKKNESDTLRFLVHDMRKVIKNELFNYIFNLFTSFGYFDSDEEHIKVLNSVKQNLKDNGVFILDFFNTTKVTSNLVPFEEKEIDNVLFKIHRVVENKNIIKQINVIDGDKDFNFEEKVAALKLQDFKNMFTKIGMRIIETFGDYNLNSFDEQQSDRLILVVKKLNA